MSSRTRQPQFSPQGFNGSGQLGNGSKVNASTAVSVSGLSQVAAVSAGTYHSVALTADCHVYAWGNNGLGQLSNGSTTSATTPVEVQGPGGTGALSNVVAVSAGTYHSLVLTADGQVFAWEDNANGQLGNGTTTNASRPTSVVDTGGTRLPFERSVHQHRFLFLAGDYEHGPGVHLGAK